MKIVNEAISHPGVEKYDLYDISKNKAMDLIYANWDKKDIAITYYDRHAQTNKTTDGDGDVRNLIYTIRWDNCVWLTIKDKV